MSIATPALQYSVNGGGNTPVGGASIAVAPGSTLQISLVSTTGINFASFDVSSPNSGLNGANSLWNSFGTASITLLVPLAGGSLTVNVRVSDGQNTAYSFASFYAPASTAATNSAGNAAAGAASTSTIRGYNAVDFGALSHGTTDNAPAIQAAIGTAAADGGRREVYIPRDNTNSFSNTYYNTNSPIECVVTQGPMWIRGENQNVTIRATGFVGPAMIFRPPIVAPTPVQDGVSGFWGYNMAGAWSTWLPLNVLSTCGLSGLKAFTCEFWIKWAGPTNGVILASSGRRAVGEPTTVAFKVATNSSSKLVVTINTSITGTQTYTSTASIPNNTRTKIEIAFDQATTAVRIYIGGNFDGSLALAGGETMVQGWEDLTLFALSPDYPFGMTGPGSGIPPNAIFYSLRLSNFARHTTGSNYTPESNEITVADPGTMLLLNFDPNASVGNPAFGTSASSAAGMIKGACNLNLQGIIGPAYIPWQSNTYTQQAGPFSLTDITVQSVGTSGIWFDLCPNTRVERVGTVGGHMGLSLYNNCFISKVDDILLAGIGNTIGSGGNIQKTPKAFAFLSVAGGPQDFRCFQTSGGDIGCIFANCTGQLAGKSYILPNGAVGILVKAVGAFYEMLFDATGVGDETELITDAAIMVTGQSGIQTAAGTVSITQGSTAVVGTNTHFVGLGLSAVAGYQVLFSPQPGVAYPIASVADDTHLTLAVPYTGTTNGAASYATPTGAGLSTRWNGGSPQVLTTGAPVVIIDGGTSHEFDSQMWAGFANGSVIFKFITAPDLGTLVRGSQNATFSIGTYCKWMPQNGVAGQGLLYVDLMRRGVMHKFPVPDQAGAFDVDINDSMWDHLAPIGFLSATRTFLMPLVAGYEWTIDTTFQTSTVHQAMTFQCHGGGGSVTIAADKRARVACYDVSVGLVRVGPDT